MENLLFARMTQVMGSKSKYSKKVKRTDNNYIYHPIFINTEFSPFQQTSTSNNGEVTTVGNTPY